MKEFNFEKWKIEADPEATREFYVNFPIITGICDCLYCKNYVEASEDLPDEVLDFFSSLGLNICKSAEIYDIDQKEDGIYSYGGFYHIAGNLLTDLEFYSQPKPKLYTLTEHFKIGFTHLTTLVPDGFPRPVLQMEILAEIPWVLQGE